MKRLPGNNIDKRVKDNESSSQNVFICTHLIEKDSHKAVESIKKMRGDK